MKKKKKPSCKK